MATTTTDRRQGLNPGAAVKVPCKAATTANITLSGEQTIDGVSITTGDRVLVKNQTTASENGIYVADTSSWERDKDWDGRYDVKKGTVVRVTTGTVNQGFWYVTTADPITPGTTSVSFSRTVNSSEIPAVATISDLRSINPEGLSDNDTVIVLGHTTVGVGGGDFYWDSSSSDADDNGITMLPTGYAGVGRWKRSYSGAVRAEWFGATGDGTDQTTALQSWLTHDSYAKEVGMGHFKYTSLNITKPTLIRGLSSKHIYKRGVTGIVVGDLTDATIFEGTSTTSPGLNCATTTAQSGLHIEGIVFYQTHADYSAPTDYPYCISDENSTSYWTGVTFKRLMFVNTNKGINLTKSERFDVTDINADFFRRGINIATNNDVSKMERIHIWNFSGTTANTFKASSSSDWAIYVDDIDELYARDIFIYGRYKGAYFTSAWMTLDGYTADTVGYPLQLDSPIGFATHLRDIKINCENNVGDVAAAIYVTGTAAASSSVIISDVSVWDGGNYSSSYNSTVELDCTSLVCVLQNFNHKYAKLNGVKITTASDVTISNHRFTNSFPNQNLGTAFDLTSVGIRNESTSAKVRIHNVRAGTLSYLFDGYCENVTFDDAPSLIELKPDIQENSGTGSITPSYTSGIRKGRYVDTDSAGTFAGLRMISQRVQNAYMFSTKPYIFGVEYQNITALTGPAGDTRFITLPAPSGTDAYVSLSAAIHSARRLSVVCRATLATSGSLVAGAYARTFSGTMDVFSGYICEGDLLVRATKDPEVVRSSAPTNTSISYAVGELYYDSAPTAGDFAGWVCVTAGAPGTWAKYGVIELTGSATWDPGNLADGAGETSASITVTGAALGDFAIASAPYDLQGITCNAYVDAANSVKIRLQNETGGTIDLASGTWRVRVIKQ